MKEQIKAMGGQIAENISKARAVRGLTQEQVANFLGISRATYNNIESGKSKPNVDIIERLSTILNVPVAEFFDEPRNNEKFKQMYFYILENFKSGIPKTKLAKLLYLADFSYFYDYLESMSGVRYVRREYGPVADIFFEMTEDMYDKGEINIDILSGGANMMSIKSSTYNPDDSLLSDKEKERLGAICELWKDKRTEEIVNYTHGQKPWKACLDGEYIPYSLITQENPDHVYTPVA